MRFNKKRFFIFYIAFAFIFLADGYVQPKGTYSGLPGNADFGILGGLPIQRVSVDSAGVQGNILSGISSITISPDGRYVAFESYASNLVPDDTNNISDVFVYDRQNYSIERVSVDSAGVQGNNQSSDPSISADGRYMAFSSDATNLVPGDTNGTSDVFVYDRQIDAIERLSVDSAGIQGNDDSYSPSISADGRFVTFVSLSINLVPGDTNGASDVFVYDQQTDSIERVNVDSQGIQANGFSAYSSINADGRYVAFRSGATNLVSGDTNGAFDIFVYDRQTNSIERVSMDSAGVQGNNDSYSPSISADGRYVTFYSSASNLVSGDTNGASDVFVYDRQTDTIERVSVDSAGVQGNSSSGFSSISADGRYVAFESDASNLVSYDTNDVRDVFVYDRQIDTIKRVSVDSAGVQGNDKSGFTSITISADGKYVVFASDATNLVPGDTNGNSDVFVAPVE